MNSALSKSKRRGKAAVVRNKVSTVTQEVNGICKDTVAGNHNPAISQWNTFPALKRRDVHVRH